MTLIPLRLSRNRQLVVGLLSGVCVVGGGMVSTVAADAVAAPQPHVISGEGYGTDVIAAPERTQVSFGYTPTGFRVGTGNEHQSRPAVSLIKLYIADYVFTHGDPADHAAATRMIQYSDDGIASRLHHKYPQAIDETARTYGLRDTHVGPTWGFSHTSTYDVTSFLMAKRATNPNDPVLQAMATASSVAADGMRQDYGTAVLPGVIGSKWGWTDDRHGLTASASYGNDFVVAASTYGPAEQLTDDVRAAFRSHDSGVSGEGSTPTMGAAMPAPAGFHNVPVRASGQQWIENNQTVLRRAFGALPLGPVSVGEQMARAFAAIFGPLVGTLPEYITLPGAA